MSSIPEHLRHIAFENLESDVREALLDQATFEKNFKELN